MARKKWQSVSTEAGKNDLKQKNLMKLLARTQFLAESTQHSNPLLAQKIYEYEQLLRNNVTIKGVHGDHVHEGGQVKRKDEDDEEHGDEEFFLKDFIIR